MNKKNSPEPTKTPENSAHAAKAAYLLEVSRQVEMALASPDTAQPVKDCLKTIIGEASSEANLPLGDFSLVRQALPNIIENLTEDYGRGVLHSIAAIICSDTKAFKDHYAQRLDEQAENQPPIFVPPDAEQVTQSEKARQYRVWANKRIEGLASHLIMATLTDQEIADTLFAIFDVLVNAHEDAWIVAEDACFNIFPFAPEHDAGFNQWSNRVLGAGGAQKIAAEPLDLSGCAPEQLNTRISEITDPKDLACALSGILKNPLLPVKLYNAVADELSLIGDTDAPENILLNFKAMDKPEVAK